MSKIAHKIRGSTSFDEMVQDRIEISHHTLEVEQGRRQRKLSDAMMMRVRAEMEFTEKSPNRPKNLIEIKSLTDNDMEWHILIKEKNGSIVKLKIEFQPEHPIKEPKMTLLTSTSAACLAGSPKITAKMLGVQWSSSTTILTILRALEDVLMGQPLGQRRQSLTP